MRNNIIYFIFVSTLIFSPLAFGSVEGWSLAIMGIFALSACCLYLYSASKSDGNPIYETPGAAPLIFFVFYILVQIIPLPAALMKLISPSTYDLYQGGAGITGQIYWMPISLNPKATLSEFIRFASYAAFYFLTVQILVSREYLKKTVFLITFFGAVLALFSIFQYVMSNGKIYWFRKVEAASIFGPYANRNHYAGLMNMIIPIALSLLLSMKPVMVYGSMRDKIRDALSSGEFGKYILVGVAAITMIVSVFLTLSKGGVISLCAALSFFFFLRLIRGGGKRGVVVLVIVCLAALLFVGWFGWGPIISRFQQLNIYNTEEAEALDRLAIWKNSSSIFKDFPITGSGFGCMSYIYPKYESQWTEMKVLYAHNDYLQLLVEGGLIAFIFAAWFVCSVIFKSFKVIRKRKDSFSIALFVGGLSGVFAMAVFSLSDFNMQIGANALYFFFLLGLITSASHTRLRGSSETTYLKQKSALSARRGLYLAAAAGVICIIFNIGVLAGSGGRSMVRQAGSLKTLGSAELEILRTAVGKAIIFDPLEAKYYYAAAAIEEALENPDKATVLIERALTLDPMNSEYMQRLGLYLYKKGIIDAGDKLIRAGVDYDPSNPERHKFLIIHLLQTQRKSEITESVKKAISAAPDRADDLIVLMMLYKVDYQEIRRSLPDLAAAHIAYASYLANSGRQAEADNAFIEALNYAEKEKRPHKSHFMKIAAYYDGRGLYDNAIAVIKKGKELFPKDSEIHYYAGLIYEKLNMKTAALKEYKKAYALDISNVAARRRIGEIEDK